MRKAYRPMLGRQKSGGYSGMLHQCLQEGRLAVLRSAEVEDEKQMNV